MIRLSLIAIAALLLAQTAFGYSPEALLEKSMVKVPELESGSTLQFLNPFSRISIGLEASKGKANGKITPDDNNRTRFRDQKDKQKELSLDLRPKGLFEIVSYGRYEKSLAARTELEKKILRARATKAAHELLARAAQAKEERMLVADWNLVLERSQKVSQISARSEGSARDVLKAANEVDKAKVEMAEIGSVSAGVSSSLEARGFKLEELDTSSVLSAAEMLERLAALRPNYSLTKEETLADLTVEQARVKHASDQGSKWLDSIKLSVGKGRDEIQRRRFDPATNETLIQGETRDSKSYSVGVTFNLPFLAAADLDEQRDRIKLARQEVDSQIEGNEAAEHTAALQTLVKEKLQVIAGLTSAKNAISDSLLRQDPLLALELQRTGMNKRLLQIKLLGEVRLLYIELLYETGRLADEPNLNHLSKTNKRIGA